MPAYFFAINHVGLDKNGNSKYEVFGFHKFTDTDEYFRLNKTTMVIHIGGRWSDKRESITTTQSKEQIIERIQKHFPNAVWGC